METLVFEVESILLYYLWAVCTYNCSPGAYISQQIKVPEEAIIPWRMESSQEDILA